MIILSIETSCDETAVSVVDARGTILKPQFKLLGNALYSQVRLHAKYGGVMPNLAKREHAKNLPILIAEVLKEAGLWNTVTFSSPRKVSERNLTGKKNLKGQEKIKALVHKALHREKECAEKIIKIGETIEKPVIDAIAVTFGPGLEPALWVGITVAEALGAMWNIPVIPVNHMEGHIASVLLKKTEGIKNQKSKIKIEYPMLALLISGGHTELVLTKSPLSYKILGKTRDDALGEAYDKVARMMGLPYPGGPEISKLAEKQRTRTTFFQPGKVSERNLTGKKNLNGQENKWNLPRPMIYSKDFDFSFSGLKTAVLYRIRDHKKLSPSDKAEICKEFEDAITDVIITKTKKAIDKYKPKKLIVGGGVVANHHIRKSFKELVKKYRGLPLSIPEMELATDNSVMIAMAGYLRILKTPSMLRSKKKIVARGTVSL